MSALQFPAARQPVVTTDLETGVPTFTRPWFLFFQSLYTRVGGPFAPTVPEVAVDRGGQGVMELQATTAQALSDLAIGDQTIPFDWMQFAIDAVVTNDALRTEIGALREEISEMKKTLNDLAQMTSL